MTEESKRKFEWTFVVAPLVGIASLYGITRFGSGPPEGPKRTVIQGSLQASDESLGTWNLKPNNCLSGFERGFKGVLFQFAGGSLVRELRIDTEREGDNIIQVVFFDAQRPAVSIRQQECTEISGADAIRYWTINGRHIEELTGETVIDCPKQKLRGHLRYEGCWPDLGLR